MTLATHVVALVLLIASCTDPPNNKPSSFEAEEGSGVVVPTPDVPNPPGALQVSGVVVELKTVHVFVTNTTQLEEGLHLCVYDCGETWDCEMAYQVLHRDQREVLEPNNGVLFQAEVPCRWQWNVLREDPRATAPIPCPEARRWGDDYPGLEHLALGTGRYLCDP